MNPTPDLQKFRWPVILPACALFALHAAMFGAWQIDDAGISFAYARNLALGHGLVAQPGALPVEGYSNPLWVFLLAGFSLFRLFDPLWTPKILSFALSFGTFALLDRLLARAGVGTGLSLLALGLLAAQSGFAIWSVSGLENPLYGFLFTGLVLLSLRAVRETEGWQMPTAAGLAAAGLALTRPEGILFAPLFPLAVALSFNRRMARLGIYLAAFAVPVGLHQAMRLAWFGAWLPNTYYAKGGPKLSSIFGQASFDATPLGRALGLLKVTFGMPGSWIALATLAAIGILFKRRKLRRETLVLGEAVLFGILPFLLLPPDWMPELRFATPFFPAALAFLAVLASDVGSLLPPNRRPLAATIFAVALVAFTLTSMIPRSIRFSVDPTVPFATVEQRYGRTYNRFADQLQIHQGSILVPDVGGTLWRSRLTVYDLGGLCNPTIAKTLGKNDRAFHDYVFLTLRPTFIHAHQYWTLRAKFDADPRFARDYLPLFEEVEPYVTARSKGQKLRSGDFVRRGVAEGHPEAVEAIRREMAASSALGTRERAE